MMGRKVVKISGALLAEFCYTGYQIGGEDRIVRVREGVPTDARYVCSWFDDGGLVLLFEHPDWPEVTGSDPYPVLTPVIESIKLKNDLTARPYARLDPAFDLHNQL